MIVNRLLVSACSVGLLLVFIGCMGLKNADDPEFNIGRFIVPYLFGFVLAIGGTFFLAGFKGQIKKMFEKERRIASITILSTLALILIFGFWTKNAVICVILVLIQFCAIFWYVSNMIPGFKKFFCCCCRVAKNSAATSGV